MNNSQIRQEISIIKEMIEKTRRETAESGHFFIAIGIFCIIVTFAIGIMHQYNLNHLVLPALLILLVGSGVIGLITVAKKEKKERVKAYPKSIFITVWIACSIPAIMITFLFPLLHVYPFYLVNILAPMIMGMGIFITGAIFESQFIKWCSLAWWIGGCVMAFADDLPRIFISIIYMIIIFLGWVLPGLFLNKQYKTIRDFNEA